MGQLKSAQPGGSIVYIEPSVFMNANGRKDSACVVKQGSKDQGQG